VSLTENGDMDALKVRSIKIINPY